MTPAKAGKLLQELYEKLWQAFGPQGWWPGETPFEVALGAILTQNTNWNNVAKVMARLKAEGLLTSPGLDGAAGGGTGRAFPPGGLLQSQGSAGEKFFGRCCRRGIRGPWSRWPGDDLEDLRPVLLEVKGIGPETADSILLYALNKPTFVVDTYTFRILSRHHLAPESCTYEELRRLFMDHLAAGPGALSGIPRPVGAAGEGILSSPTPMRGLLAAGLA